MVPNHVSIVRAQEFNWTLTHTHAYFNSVSLRESGCILVVSDDSNRTIIIIIMGNKH